MLQKQGTTNVKLQNLNVEMKTQHLNYNNQSSTKRTKINIEKAYLNLICHAIINDSFTIFKITSPESINSGIILLLPIVATCWLESNFVEVEVNKRVNDRLPPHFFRPNRVDWQSEKTVRVSPVSAFYEVD